MFDYSKTPFIAYYHVDEKVWIPMRNGRLATYDEAKELYDDLAFYMYKLRPNGENL